MFYVKVFAPQSNDVLQGVKIIYVDMESCPYDRRDGE